MNAYICVYLCVHVKLYKVRVVVMSKIPALQAEEIMKDYEPGLIENGGKMLILFSIVQQSIALGEKILVFR